MTEPLRTTDLRTTSHRRLVVRTLVAALQSVFNGSYNRDRELINLRVTATYPLEKIDYPTVVVSYEPSRNINAGVGHEEWFEDANNILRKWNHRRFEGSITFDILALTPLDRDLLADAVEEVLTFGRLDSQLAAFFTTVYGDTSDSAPYVLQFTQLMLNTDEISGGGNSESLAPWAPEDQLVYETSLSLEVHGGFYNTNPSDQWGYVTNATADSYPEGDQDVSILFKPGSLPFPDPSVAWTNPFIFLDADEVTGTAVISGSEQFG